MRFLNFGMPEIFAVICLKFKQRGQTLVRNNVVTQLGPPLKLPSVFCQDDANGVANSEGPNQTAPLRAV